MIKIPCAVFVAVALVALGCFLDGWTVRRVWLRNALDGMVVAAYLSAIAIALKMMAA